jgi:hypothetical protein
VADLNGDGAVGRQDFLWLLSAWGPCTCAGDINNDGVAGINDFLILVGNWGACP